MMLLGALLCALFVILLTFYRGEPVSYDSVRPMKLATLKADLAVMRSAIEDYTVDRGTPPQTLEELVQAKYLKAIPIDPLTMKKDWVLHFGDVATGPGKVVFGIDDVNSRTECGFDSQH